MKCEDFLLVFYLTDNYGVIFVGYKQDTKCWKDKEWHMHV